MKITIPEPKEAGVDLLIIAGEHSGDEHAASLVKKLLKERPNLKIAVLGGPCLESSGVDFLHDTMSYAVVGFFEVLKRYGELKAFYNACLKWILEHRPRAILFVDYPGFNLKIANELYDRGLAHKAGGEIQLLFYISPQIWAWKAKRRFKMARILDGLGVIFPFEKACYDDTSLPVAFVGHPFLDEGFENTIKYSPDGDLLLLPGSRVGPVKRILPELLKIFIQYRQSLPGESATIIYPNDKVKTLLKEILEGMGSLRDFVKLKSAEEPVSAKAVITTSGTVSLKCLLAGIPGVIVYKAHPITYFLGKKLIKIPFLGIGNILLGRAVYPEFIQGDIDYERIGGLIRLAVTDLRQRELAISYAKQIKQMLTATKVSVEEWLLSYL